MRWKALLQTGECLYSSLRADYTSSFMLYHFVLNNLLVLQEEKNTICELSELSFGGSPGEHSRHLSFVNKLREHWHKGQNAVVVDDHPEQVNISYIQFLVNFPYCFLYVKGCCLINSFRLLIGFSSLFSLVIYCLWMLVI